MNGMNRFDEKKNQKLYVVDTTLRDGEQSPGVAFSVAEKKHIARSLDELGVDVIEAGIPAMGRDEQRAVHEILGMGLRAEILTWNRMKREDIDKSLEIGAKNIHITVPASDIHIHKKLRSDRLSVLNTMEELVTYAVGKGCRVSVGAEDASRADLHFLLDLYQRAEKAGVCRVRYADTVSVLDPFTAYEQMALLTTFVQVPIDFHGHNDFGLGTANALGAFKGGASYISCSINGLGERAGNTPLEEIALTLSYMEKCEVGIKLEMLPHLSRLVAKYSGRWVHDSKPVVGSAVFSHEAGIHVDGLIKDPMTYEYLLPASVGRERQFVFGKHSGKTKKI